MTNKPSEPPGDSPNEARPACAALIAAQPRSGGAATKPAAAGRDPIYYFFRTGDSTRFRVLATSRGQSFTSRGSGPVEGGRGEPCRVQDSRAHRPVYRSVCGPGRSAQHVRASYRPGGPGIAAPCDPPPPFGLAAVAKISTKALPLSSYLIQGRPARCVDAPALALSASVLPAGL